MLTPEQQAAFVEEAPEIFLPIPSGWGRMEHPHIRLAAASKDALTDALQTAWKLRTDLNTKVGRKVHVRKRRGAAGKSRNAEGLFFQVVGFEFSAAA